MGSVRNKGNKGTELRLIQIFRANGITGWRRGCSLSLGVSGLRSQLSGFEATRTSGRVKPDFVFSKLRVALFVDGCFWHGCPRHATWPKTRAAFWRKKIQGNKARDREVNRLLRAKGWTVLRVWEHDLSHNNAPRLLQRLKQFVV